uniref:Zgc:85932 n=1 Tax=Hippocampus comes TaxID=109280 RepID=A0A3Q3E3Z2_HIPCM
MLRKVVPPGQTFQDGYNGSFIFRFWQYGQWEDVRIDDLLPTYGNNLIYLSSPEKREFWSSLLEKAYAKLKGGYRALDMGFPHEAMVDMTGGVAEVLSVAVLPRELPAFLAELLAKGALINCANTQGPVEYRNDLGIMFRHAYSLTAVEKVQTTYGPVDLVRILNPWGNTEWLGPWSDRNGPEWNTVSAEEQKRLHRIQREDGEFWMSVSDFRQNFETMEVCHLADLQNDASVQPWSCAMHHGTWVPHISAGGSPKGVEHGSPEPPTRCAFILALMQKFQRRRGIDLSIALHIYPLRPAMSSSYYSSRREVVLRGHLQPGRYVIIPSTAEPNQQGAFLLRVLTEQGHAATIMKILSDLINFSQQPHYPHQAALPSLKAMMQLFKKHCNKLICTNFFFFFFYNVLLCSVLAGSEKNLALEHCKSLVVLMDSQGIAQLTWSEFQALWDKIRLWTDIFLVYDKNKTQRLEYKEVAPALKAAGIVVDDLVMQLVGLRYTESDMTISYPGFLYLVMKLESMIHKFHAYDMVGMGCISLNYRQVRHSSRIYFYV